MQRAPVGSKNASAPPKSAHPLDALATPPSIPLTRATNHHHPQRHHPYNPPANLFAFATISDDMRGDALMIIKASLARPALMILRALLTRVGEAFSWYSQW